MSQTCPKCHTINSYEGKFCKKCGTKLEQNIADNISNNKMQATYSEDDIYEQIANELSQGVKKEGVWLKAFQEADGDEIKTKVLYIRYRSDVIKQEIINAQHEAAEEMQREQRRLEEQQKNDPAIPLLLNQFLAENNMQVLKKLSNVQVLANYYNTPIDVFLVFNGALKKWEVVEL